MGNETFYTNCATVLDSREIDAASAVVVMKNIRRCIHRGLEFNNVDITKVQKSIARRIVKAEGVDELNASLEELYWYIAGWSDTE